MMPTDHDTPLPDPPHPRQTGARVPCPVCGRDVTLSPVSRIIPNHYGNGWSGEARKPNGLCDASSDSLSDEARRNSRSSLFSPHEFGRRGLDVILDVPALPSGPIDLDHPPADIED